MSDLKYFTQIPAWVDEIDNINDFQVRLLGFVYTLENTTGTAFPSNKRLAEKYHKSIKTVQNALSDLYTKGLLKSKVVYKENSKEISKRYLYIVEPDEGKSTGVPTPKNEGTLPLKSGVPTPEIGADNISLNKSSNKSINNTPPTPSQGDESDEQLFDPFLAEKMLDGFNKATRRQVKNKGTFSKLVMNGVKYQEFSDVLHWVFDTWSDPSMLTSSGLVKKFDQYSDTANELGFVNGQRPKKKPKVQSNNFGRRQVQEPEMVTGGDNQQPSDDFQAALDDLRGIKTKG
ncbi:helix-turn-helix domain-containing protein [Convivina praedatoris]|uniref:helix-turn-helix domain-containing protein n=1 Tax=Convivina praedatoris TaxID=2880963 RepID=UPI00200C9D45|nr:helix-turn-helix domain-containing protein [Convivina sp. LMG 32447]CAH1855972.1 hypothetical protein R078138_01231 [Convivina sp. LMG 32447]